MKKKSPGRVAAGRDRASDLVGKEFSGCLVLRAGSRRTAAGEIVWVYRCPECGGEGRTPGSNLTGNRTTRCAKCSAAAKKKTDRNREIARAVSGGLSQTDAAKQFGISAARVCQILKSLSGS